MVLDFPLQTVVPPLLPGHGVEDKGRERLPGRLLLPGVLSLAEVPDMQRADMQGKGQVALSLPL